MAATLLETINRMLAPIRTRVMNMVSRGVVTRVDDGPKLQSLQLGLLEGETRNDLERFQNYGFTSVPKDGAEAVVLFVSGGRDHGLVVAVDDRRYRPTGLQPGEVAIYTDQGDSVTIKRGGTIVINASTQIELNGNSDAVAMAAKVNARCAAIENVLKTWTVVPNDGGAALKALAVTNLSSPASVASTKVKLS